MPTEHPRLAAALREHIRVQRVRNLRIALLHVLAAGGLVVWVSLVWPGHIPFWGRVLAVIAWPACLALFVLLLFVEWRGNARLARITGEDRL